MDKLPLVSVVVMSYNNQRYIEQTVSSVLAQTGVNLELIVVDDHSSDDTVDILQKYKTDSRFSLIVHPVNLGIIKNGSYCLTVGSGKYVTVIGSDDFMLPGHLSSLVSAMESHPECDLAYTQCTWVDENDNVIKVLEHPGHFSCSYYGGRQECADLLIYDNYITPSASMFRASCIESLRLPDGNFYYHGMMAGDWLCCTNQLQVELPQSPGRSIPCGPF
ncbi:glycosyltransferase family 2 protein, partial [Vogesella urethralis]|uniref:glycosyltransferase family 2 protein n=1 Tax=Vogesella urethralis TaxID=2592656 RepID=UPI001185EF18